MIHESIRMKFSPDNLAEATEILSSTVERTRFTPGCLGCDIYQDLNETGVLLLEGWWNTRADLERHLRSDPYRRVILVMEMAVEHPLVRFSEIIKTTGMETIKNSRFGTSSGD